MPRDPVLRSHAANAIVPAVLFFIFAGQFTGISTSDWYNFTVDLFNWTLRAGYVAYAVIAVLCYVGVWPALLVDAVVTMACSASFLIVGIEWARQGELNGYLCLLFCIMFAAAGRHSFQTWRRRRPGIRTGEPVAASPAPAHPAAEHPDVLPAGDQPPPAEGYLAALAREKKDAPRADLE